MRIVPLLLLAGLACGRPAQTAPGAENPAGVVEGFLAAVKANDLDRMGQLWGLADRGPAADWADAETVHKHLFVIQSRLVHDRFELLPLNESALRNDKPVIRVRLLRSGCEAVVPFTMVRHKGGWLIEQVDLATAGNPAEKCP
ncbi:MAG TPA: hypothetical protein VFH97_06260 [Gemmatimonadales bacterium]|nr:hypothetical protein [Gemmatimonadales bacterium]